MNKTNFIQRKLEHYINNIDNMNDEEVTQAQLFVLTTCKHHFEKMDELINLTNKTNEETLELIKEKESDIEFYQSFIQDNNLGKRYQFYCKQKGVI